MRWGCRWISIFIGLYLYLTWQFECLTFGLKSMLPCILYTVEDLRESGYLSSRRFHV